MHYLSRFSDWFYGQPLAMQRFFSVLLIILVTLALLQLLKLALNHMVKKGLDSSAKPLLYSLFSYTLYIVALLAILNVAGVNTAGIVTMVGAASGRPGDGQNAGLRYRSRKILQHVFTPVRKVHVFGAHTTEGHVLAVGHVLHLGRFIQQVEHPFA